MPKKKTLFLIPWEISKKVKNHLHLIYRNKKNLFLHVEIIKHQNFSSAYFSFYRFSFIFSDFMTESYSCKFKLREIDFSQEYITSRLFHVYYCELTYLS